MAYTPGPWFKTTPHEEPDEAKGFIVSEAEPDTWLAFCRYDGREEENASLISAAPDLLEALQLHIIYEGTPTDRGGSQGPKGKAWKAFIEARDKAIAKATGK